MVPQGNKKYTYDQFIEITKNTEDRLEYLNGDIYCQATPTLMHQRIIRKICNYLSNYFEGTKCEPFFAPYDILLMNETEKYRVQPDIFVLCGEKDMDENEFVGIPSLIIEVLSPSNASHDLIKKLNIYMKFKVSEYWIVIPQSNTIQVYELKDDFYEQVKIYTEKDLLKSSIFNGLSFQLNTIF